MVFMTRSESRRRCNQGKSRIPEFTKLTTKKINVKSEDQQIVSKTKSDNDPDTISESVSAGLVTPRTLCKKGKLQTKETPSKELTSRRSTRQSARFASESISTSFKDPLKVHMQDEKPMASFNDVKNVNSVPNSEATQTENDVSTEVKSKQGTNVLCQVEKFQDSDIAKVENLQSDKTTPEKKDSKRRSTQKSAIKASEKMDTKLQCLNRTQVGQNDSNEVVPENESQIVEMELKQDTETNTSVQKVENSAETDIIKLQIEDTSLKEISTPRRLTQKSAINTSENIISTVSVPVMSPRMTRATMKSSVKACVSVTSSKAGAALKSPGKASILMKSPDKASIPLKNPRKTSTDLKSLGKASTLVKSSRKSRAILSLEVGNPVESSQEVNMLVESLEVTSAPVMSPELTNAPIGSPEATGALVGSPEATDAPVGSPEATGAPVGSPKVTNAPIGSPEATSAPIGSPEATGAPAGSLDANDAPIGSPEATGASVGSPEANSAPFGSPEANGAPIGSPEANSAPVGSPEANGVPVGNPEENSAPVGNPKATDAPVGSPEATGAPVGSPEANGAPFRSPKANGAPFGSPEANGAPVGSPEVNGAPVGSPEATGAPVGNSEATGAPVWSPEATGAPVGSPKPTGAPVGNLTRINTKLSKLIVSLSNKKSDSVFDSEEITNSSLGKSAENSNQFMSLSAGEENNMSAKSISKTDISKPENREGTGKKTDQETALETPFQRVSFGNAEESKADKFFHMKTKYPAQDLKKPLKTKKEEDSKENKGLKRKVTAQHADENVSRETCSNAKKKRPSKGILFIESLPEYVEASNIKTLFSENKIKLQKYKTLKSGAAIVQLKDWSEIGKAVSLLSENFLGKAIRINSLKEDQCDNDHCMNQSNQAPMTEKMADIVITEDGKCKLVVNNLPADCKLEDLAKMFPVATAIKLYSEKRYAVVKNAKQAAPLPDENVQKAKVDGRCVEQKVPKKKVKKSKPCGEEEECSQILYIEGDFKHFSLLQLSNFFNGKILLKKNRYIVVKFKDIKTSKKYFTQLMKINCNNEIVTVKYLPKRK